MVRVGATSCRILVAENATYLLVVRSLFGCVRCRNFDPTLHPVQSAHSVYICDGMCVDLSMLLHQTPLLSLYSCQIQYSKWGYKIIRPNQASKSVPTHRPILSLAFHSWILGYIISSCAETSIPSKVFACSNPPPPQKMWIEELSSL